MEEWAERDSCSAGEKSPGGAGQQRSMGSRRIFAPQFKLQVLDSYRQDPDCKGNQRATARKYGIHRRQIQKWLQMESHLRSITGSGSATGPSSPGGVSSVSLSSPLPLGGVAVSPVPSPSPSSSHGSHSLLGEPLHLSALGLGPSSHPAFVSAALNLSCEARLLGGVVRNHAMALTAAREASSPAPSSSSGASGAHSPRDADDARDADAASPRAREAATPSPVSHGVAHGVAVPRLSASPTLPIKKRWLNPDSELGSPAMTSPSASDEEDDDDEEDIDVDGTESESDSALDYTTATLSKRRSFPLHFKLQVLDAFRDDLHCQGNQRATARRFGINRRQVQKWLGQEAELREEAVARGGLNRQRLGRWLEQDEQADQAADAGCLDLSRKRKHELVSSDAEDSEHPDAEEKKPRLAPSPPAAGAAAACPRLEDAFRLGGGAPTLPPHPLLFRPQPLPLMPHLPNLPSLPLSLPLPFNLCAKQYSVDLKLSSFNYFTAQQQNLQKWLKPEDFLKHTSNASFLLNSFR